MPDYRIYKLSKDGHIDGPPLIIAYEDDEQAIKYANQIFAGHKLELWDGSRQVCVLDPPD
jgi:hypothetical protein